MARSVKEKARKITRENRIENAGARRVPILQLLLLAAEVGSVEAKRVKIGLNQSEREENQQTWEDSHSIQGEHYQPNETQSKLSPATSPHDPQHCYHKQLLSLVITLIDMVSEEGLPREPTTLFVHLY